MSEAFRVAGRMLKPAQKPLEVAGAVVTALPLPVEGAITTLGVSSASADAVTFYRGVSAAEAADVDATGSLRAGAAASGNEGKYLTNTIEAASKWGAQNGAGAKVLSVTVPADAVRQFTYLGRIDGIGQAWHAPMSALSSAQVKILGEILTPVPK